jgi:3-oxoacyl-[acyl-carrier protein] reductase
MDLGLKGRSCVVTGASRGIGRETARLLCAEGAKVLLVARSEEALAAAAEEASGAGAATGGDAATLTLDITTDDAGERMLAAAEERFGSLDVLVNNAGAAKWRDLDDVPDEDWRAQFELNVMAPLRAMRVAAPAMAERRWGRIVNVCSTAGKRPSAAMPEYSVAKAAELSLSRLFADRYAKQGVLVNAICPGPVEAELWMEPGGLLDQAQEMSGAASREEALAEAGAKRPIGRLAEVGEIAAAIVFLCSERASYVSGAAWSVDGGTVQVIIWAERAWPASSSLPRKRSPWAPGGAWMQPSWFPFMGGQRNRASSSPSGAPTSAATPARSHSRADDRTRAMRTCWRPPCGRLKRRSRSSRPRLS